MTTCSELKWVTLRYHSFSNTSVIRLFPITNLSYGGTYQTLYTRITLHVQQINDGVKTINNWTTLPSLPRQTAPLLSHLSGQSTTPCTMIASLPHYMAQTPALAHPSCPG